MNKGCLYHDFIAWARALLLNLMTCYYSEQEAKPALPVTSTDNPFGPRGSICWSFQSNGLKQKGIFIHLLQDVGNDVHIILISRREKAWSSFKISIHFYIETRKSHQNFHILFFFSYTYFEKKKDEVSEERISFIYFGTRKSTMQIKWIYPESHSAHFMDKGSKKRKTNLEDTIS